MPPFRSVLGVAADHAFLDSGGEGGPSNGPDASCVTIVFPEPSTAWGNGRDMVARRRIPLGAALAAEKVAAETVVREAREAAAQEAAMALEASTAQLAAAQQAQ